jgi:serine/threonine protein kinase
MLLYFLPKQRGGRLQHVATFCTACENTAKNPDARWWMDEVLQYLEEASDGFSVVGLTKVLKERVVVKMMLLGRMASQERVVQDWFRKLPHPNVVQGICHFVCPENPLKWEKRAKTPISFCNISENTPVQIILQEFIQSGSLRDVTEWSIEKWRSVLLQLTYAVLEWYEKHGFLYGDWHFGNVLLDVTEKKRLQYEAFGKKWFVRDSCGVRPVITDFARSTLRPIGTLAPWQLADQLGYVWDMMAHVCPDEVIKGQIRQMSIKVGGYETLDALCAICLECATLVQ